MMKVFYVASPLQAGAVVALPGLLSHRLQKVLRLAAGATVGLFNGQDGLWAATLDGPKLTHAVVGACVRPQPPVLPLTLLLGGVKREAFETALRQATELGVQAIQPVLTAYAQRSQFNPERAHAIMIEAAEQCERLSVPMLSDFMTLEQAVAAHPAIFWAAERVAGEVALAPWPQPLDHLAVLVGPEGGFSPAEKAWLLAQPQVQAHGLGPTILRADTAVVAALTRAQVLLGV